MKFLSVRTSAILVGELTYNDVARSEDIVIALWFRSMFQSQLWGLMAALEMITGIMAWWVGSKPDRYTSANFATRLPPVPYNTATVTRLYWFCLISPTLQPRMHQSTSHKAERDSKETRTPCIITSLAKGELSTSSKCIMGLLTCRRHFRRT